MAPTSILRLMLLLFMIYPPLCRSQLNNTLNDLWFTSTLFDDEPNTVDTISIPIYWLFTMVLSGIIGTILIPIIFVHTYYNWCKQEITGTLSRILYTIFFSSYWIVCISYAFLRTDLIFPMGHGIDCKIGFFLCTNGVFLSKLTLFIIFLVRIDLAFHSSALGYPRKCLFVIMSIYTLIICLLNAMYIIVTWNIVSFASIPYILPFNNMTMGICSAGHNATTQWRMVLTLMGIGDLIFSLIVCGLFVYKLNKVVQMTKQDNHNQFAVKPSRHDTERENKLSQIMRKQTVLVIFAVSTSELILIGGGMYAPISYQVPMDAVANVFAVWLMFNFADNIWNKCIKYCCCCCYCCIEKEQFLMSLESISRKISVRSRGSSAAPTKSSSFSNRDQHATIRSNDTDNLPTIAERKSEKVDDIEIKFDNEWKTHDLPTKKQQNNNNNNNINKEYMAHSDTKDLQIDTMGNTNDIELVCDDKSDSKSRERVLNESPASNPEKPPTSNIPSHTKPALSSVSSNSDSEPEPDNIDITQQTDIPSYKICNLQCKADTDQPPMINQKSTSIPSLMWHDSPHSTAL